MKKLSILVLSAIFVATAACAGIKTVNVVPVPTSEGYVGDGIEEVFVPDDGIAEVFVPTEAEKAAIEAWKADFNK